jgi:hypothetical protein
MVVACLQFYAGRCLEELSIATKIFSEHSQRLDPVSKLVPLQYKSETLLISASSV